MLLAVVVALLAQRTLPAEVGDSNRVRACESLAAEVARGETASDLAAALAVHGRVARWTTARRGRSLTVWLQERPRDLEAALRTGAEWRAAVAEGVLGWSGAVSGLRLAIGRDSAAADVRVVWAATLPAAEPGDPAAGALASLTAGRTTVSVDPDGRFTHALVVIAASTRAGVPYQPSDVRAVTRHEIGHALGLAHHASPASVMAPLVSADRVGGADRGALRALYGLPVGAACGTRE